MVCLLTDLQAYLESKQSVVFYVGLKKKTNLKQVRYFYEGHSMFQYFINFVNALIKIKLIRCAAFFFFNKNIYRDTIYRKVL